MVYESYPWKRDLLRRKSLILRYNTKKQFAKNEEAAYNVIEKGIFYSAFIIRKLIDCAGKTSDEVNRYQLTTETIMPIKPIDVLHRWPTEENYDWAHKKSVKAYGKYVCNWLIHSYVFFLEYDDNCVTGFYVSSDYDRNRVLYRISIKDWIKYMNFVATDSVVATDCHYSVEKMDYVYTKKERGSL